MIFNNKSRCWSTEDVNHHNDWTLLNLNGIVLIRSCVFGFTQWDPVRITRTLTIPKQVFGPTEEVTHYAFEGSGNSTMSCLVHKHVVGSIDDYTSSIWCPCSLTINFPIKTATLNVDTITFQHKSVKSSEHDCCTSWGSIIQKGGTPVIIALLETTLDDSNAANQKVVKDIPVNDITMWSNATPNIQGFYGMHRSRKLTKRNLKH